MDAETVAGRIKYKLSVTALLLETIANELEFSSLAHFSRFCKRYLGYFPRELRQQIKDDSTISDGIG